SGRKHTAASGEITLESDQSPIIDFTNENRNFYVNPGSTVPLVLQATDDFGIRGIEITARPPEQKKGAKQLKEWTYLGPPGSRGPVKESFELVVEPERFVPGSTWLVEASASDFRKDSRPGKSRPIILRVKTLDQMAVPRSDSLSGAFAVLKRLIAEQKQANGLTENLKVHLEEALERKTLSAHVNQMAKRQAKAKNTGSFAIALFRRHKEGERYAIRIEPLLNGEMSWVMRDILQVNKKPVDALPKFLASIEERQEYILRQLMALLGQVADSRKDSAKKVPEAEDDGRKPIPIEDELADLKDDLEKYVREQKRLLERSKSLMDEGPEDLTEEEEEILGELAREEAKWATFFEEKLTDFSKLPDQDFADGSLSEEFNEVFQEVKLAAKELYEKKIELAVPHEQSGLELAEELIHNLERWMPDTPDHKKWLMEEPMAPEDAPMAELPSELEDIVGELLDSEEEMTDDVEDVTSSFMDSLDKGAGWDAADGPISNMSAKGITGNQLPNQQEIGGRSGEGRSGRSHGQMVEETAEGKGGRETPTRLSPSPFETGSVEDTSKENKGGATGGGKLSGFEEEGLRGPTPPPTQQKLARLSGQQGKLRQQAEALNPKLKAYNLPTGDLEHAIAAMKQFEEDAKAGRGLRLRQTFTRILDSLDEAKSSIGRETGIHRERIKLPEWMRGEIMSGYKDGIPAGYEEMVSEYFRVLAEKGSDGKKGE
ncbi:MAG: hypothetical protein QF473_01240, partial [Planctomycetota bacterium]|nr:hypothetical protein [Planctomycetota bacterium]